MFAKSISLVVIRLETTYRYHDCGVLGRPLLSGERLSADDDDNVQLSWIFFILTDIRYPLRRVLVARRLPVILGRGIRLAAHPYDLQIQYNEVIACHFEPPLIRPGVLFIGFDIADGSQTQRCTIR